MALALDRKAFINILRRRQGHDRRGDAAGAGRQVGHAGGAGQELPGYGRRREEPGRGAQDHGGLGYSAGNPLKVKVSTRNIAIYRDPAVIFIDQMKKIHIEGELEVVDTTSGTPRCSARTTPSAST